MRYTKRNIYLENLKENFNNIKNILNNTKTCCAVKADAYGHGAVEVAKTLEEQGCDYLAVATAPEAIELFNSGVKKPILLLSLLTPEELKTVLKPGIELIADTSEYIKLINEISEERGITSEIHLKVDTGMGRIGCTPDNAPGLVKLIMSLKNCNFKGIATHFATSDDEDRSYLESQLSKFTGVLDELEREGIKPELVHCSNSGGLLKIESSRINMARPGIILYGYYPSPDLKKKIKIKPVMELESKVVSLKELPPGSSISYGRTYTTKNREIIALLPIGYADGYSRLLSNRGEVVINGKRFPVVGKVCMDQLMIRVDESVKLHDRAILLGINQGEPDADEIAEKIGTISYEVLTNLHRVGKHFIK